MNDLLATVARGAILIKNAPTVLRKEAPIKRGDNIELRLEFNAATNEEVKKALGGDAPDGYIAGWASTSSRDSYNHEVVAGAFQEAMDARGLSGPRSIKLLLDHDWKRPAGVIKVLEYRRGKLWMEAQMNLDVGYVKERWQMLKMMGGANFSVGFMLQDYAVVVKDDDEDDYYLRIDKGDLFEISIVMFPGNEEAMMTFVKAALHDENADEDKLFFAKTVKASWKLGVSKNLPLHAGEEWNAPVAKERVFRAAGFDTDKINHEIARKAFLVHDSANPDLRGSYRLQIADIVDGKLQVTAGALRHAAKALATTDLSAELKSAARAVLELYQERSVDVARTSKDVPQTLAEFEKALVAKGLVSGRNIAREIALVAKTCPQLFIKQEHEVITPPPPALDADKLAKMVLLAKQMKSVIAPAAE